MSNVWFCSDLHFGHVGINKFREVTDEAHNRRLITDAWQENVRKDDVVYVLGDACFTMETVDEFSALKGVKHLIRGNHDKLDTQVYLKYFKSVEGIVRYKEFWLTHAPIHPLELRNKVNLHGHVHFATIPDKRYFNCCPENLWELVKRPLISLDEIRRILKCE